jgi:hypothetical protein
MVVGVCGATRTSDTSSILPFYPLTYVAPAGKNRPGIDLSGECGRSMLARRSSGSEAEDASGLADG